MKKKSVLINFRVTVELRDELNALARLQGLTTSSWLHSQAVKAISEAKRKDLELFEQMLQEVRKEPPNRVPGPTNKE